MTPLHLSARSTGMAGLSTAWPTGGGWSCRGTRRGLRRLGTYYAQSEVSASAHRLTDLYPNSSRQLTSASRLSASVRLTRTIDSSRVDSDPTRTTIKMSNNSLAINCGSNHEWRLSAPSAVVHFILYDSIWTTFRHGRHSYHSLHGSSTSGKLVLLWRQFNILAIYQYKPRTDTVWAHYSDTCCCLTPTGYFSTYGHGRRSTTDHKALQHLENQYCYE